MGEEVVPGLGEAIEARRLELGLSPGQFAERADLTAQGLAPIRKGYRRNYQTKLKVGVARALGWPMDAVDRLLAGEDPAGFDTIPDVSTEGVSERLMRSYEERMDQQDVDLAAIEREVAELRDAVREVREIVRSISRQPRPEDD